MKKALIIALICLWGCMREHERNGFAEHESSYRITAAVEAEEGPRTKGNIAYDTGAGSDFCWLILKDNILLYYGTGEVDNVVLSANVNYTVLAWANTTGGKGGLNFGVADAVNSIRNTGSIDEMLSIAYRFGSTRADWDGLKIPASYYAAGIGPDELDALDGNADGVIRFPLRRLTAKLNLTIAYDDMLQTMFPSETLSGTQYGIKVNSVKLGGMSQSVGLFSNAFNVRGTASSTLDQSTGSQAYGFYIPESLGGNLLPGNNSPLHKDAASLSSVGADPNAYPYLEASITFSAYMVSLAFTRTYRFYLGENSTSNFDIRRNHEYDITLLLSYDGLDVVDSWKLDGEPSALGNRTCAIISCNKPRAAAGEKVVLTARYEYGGEGNVAADFYLRQNGFALCTGSDKAAYLNAGTPPSGFSQLADDEFILECNECHHYYTGMPSVGGSARQAWLSANLSCHGDEVRCMWCAAHLFNMNDGSDDWLKFSTSPSTYTSTATSCLGQYGCDFEYTIPANASEGDVIRIHAITRDGRAGSYTDLTVTSEFGAPELGTPLGNGLWVAQKTTLTASDWAEGVFGENPSFSFSISCLNSAGIADNTVARISVIDSKRVYVSALKPGTFTITCNSAGEPAGSFSGTVSAPSIGYPGNGSNNRITVKNNGVRTSFTAPGYIVPDPGNGTWVQYTTYDETLFGECLGTPTGTLADNNGWVAIDEDGVYLSHAYKNGIVADSNLLPYNTTDTRLELIRFVSPKLPGVCTCDIPVYFDFRYVNLACIIEYGDYNKYIADNYTAPSQPSLQFSVSPYWIWSNFPEDEFFSEVNGEPGNNVSVIISRGNGNFMFNTTTLGRKRFYWRLKGSGSDSYELTLCSITCKQHYIGSITCSCDEDNTSTRHNIYGGFVQWLDSPIGAYSTPGDSEVSSGTLQGFRVYVGCKNIVKDLFRINHSAVLPTQGVYNPNPVSNSEGWNYYQNSRNAVFYTQARHYYNDSDLSYTAAMARWGSYYAVVLLTTIETHGFGMDKYKSFNPPLFVPVTSPATINGITWNKTADDGATAVWERSDGLQTCTFTYGTW